MRRGSNGRRRHYRFVGAVISRRRFLYPSALGYFDMGFLHPFRRRTLKPKLLFHLPANLLGFLPMMARPYRPAGHKADPVPDNVKMLPSILDMFDNHPLVVEHFIAVLFLTPRHDCQNLLIRQPFVLHGVDADMMQRFGASGITRHFPHFLKRLIEVFGFRVADLDKARFFVFALILHIFGG